MDVGFAQNFEDPRMRITHTNLCNSRHLLPSLSQRTVQKRVGLRTARFPERLFLLVYILQNLQNLQDALISNIIIVQTDGRVTQLQVWSGTLVWSGQSSSVRSGQGVCPFPPLVCCPSHPSPSSFPSLSSPSFLPASQPARVY